MKLHRMMLRLLPLALLVCALLLALPVLADEEEPFTVSYLAAPEAEQDSTVRLQTVEGENYLFLPASAELSALALRFPGGEAELSAGDRRMTVTSGVPFDLGELCPETPEDGRYALTLSGEETVSFTLMRSEAVAALFVSSPDAEHDRTWVEQDKENKAKKGGLLMLDPDGSTVYDGGLKQLKGRGNYTWMLPKRPYQIKLSDKTDLMETGLPEEAETTWVLLADYVDPSRLHNRISFGLAAGLGLDYTPHNRPVDLWYDGEYRGAYLLSEKTEISTGRVAIPDLEGAIEKANPEVEDFDALETVQGVNSLGNPFQYVSGLTLPEEHAAGYLLEMDYENRAKAEKSWFRTSAGFYVVVKSPEYLSREGMEYICGVFQRFENAVMRQDGAALGSVADLESLAKAYLVMEYAFTQEAYLTSTFFYIPTDDGKLYGGPVWDFDNSYSNDRPQGWCAAANKLGNALTRLPEFRAAVLAQMPKLTELVNALLAEDGGLDRLLAEQRASWTMDVTVWPNQPGEDAWYNEVPKGGFAENTEPLRTFLRTRLDWMTESMADWDTKAPTLPRYADVLPGDSYYQDVAYVSDLGIFNGISANSFAPDQLMSRAMAVTVLHRLAGKPAAAWAFFPDVPAGQWYSAAVAWGANNGVVKGFDDGRFHPDTSVTLQEFLVFLHRLSGAPQVPEGDSGGAAPWAAEALRWARALELCPDGADGALDPTAPVPRHAVATILARWHRLGV